MVLLHPSLFKQYTIFYLYIIYLFSHYNLFLHLKNYLFYIILQITKILLKKSKFNKTFFLYFLKF